MARTLVPTDRQGSATATVTEAPQHPQAATPAPPRDKKRFDGPLLPLVVFSLVSMAARAEDAALGALLPQMRAEFGINLSFVAAIGSLVTISGLVLAPLLGWLADRVKRIAMVRLAAIAYAAGGILQGMAPGAAWFAAGRVVSGTSVGVAQPASFPLITDFYPSHSRARAFTIYFAAAQVGAVLGPPIAGVIADRTSWRVSIVGFGLVASAAALLAFLVKEPRRGATDIAEAPPEPVGFAEAYRAARSIVTLRRIWYATPFLAVTGLFNLLILPSYFAEVFQLTSTQTGVLVAALHGAAFAGVLAAGPVSERLLAERPGRVLSIGGALTAGQSVLLVGLAAAPSFPAALVLALPLSFLTTVLLPAFYSIISMVVPPRIRGLGLQTTAPWQVLGLVMVPGVLGASTALGVRQGILVFVPLLIIGGVVFASGASGVERDIRAAEAAAVADAEHRRRREQGGMPLLVIRDLEVSYDNVVVVSDVDLDVDVGEIVALLGTNGAGKSTLLHAIAGTQEASGGAVFFDGRDITHAPPHENAARGVAVMPGGAATFPALTVADNLRAAAWPTGNEHRIDEVLDLFPVLRTRLDTAAGSLSGGEQQMVGLAQAFVMQPRLLLIDELSLGLAPAVITDLLAILRRIAADGATVVLVEQSVDVAAAIADRAVFLEAGRIRYDGPTADLPSGLTHARFLGRTQTSGRGRPTQPRDETALAVEHVSVVYGGVHALTDVSFHVQAGDVLGIVGANGAGKTTLFDAISGFVPIAEGRIQIAGVDVTSAAPDARARHGLCRSFQSARLFPSLTVRETIATALERKAVRNPVAAALGLPVVRRSEKLIRRRADNLIDLLNLSRYADSFVSELSTGTRRAVDLACVLASEPHVLLLDEPSSGLAQGEIDELGPTLKGIARQTGCAMVLIEHDLPLVTSVSSRLLTLELGRVKEDA